MKKRKVIISEKCPGCSKSPDCSGAKLGGPTCPKGSPQYALAGEYNKLSERVFEDDSSASQNQDMFDIANNRKNLFTKMVSNNTARAIEQQEYIKGMMIPEELKVSPDFYQDVYQEGGEKPYDKKPFTFGPPAGWSEPFYKNAHQGQVYTVVNGKGVWVNDDPRYNLNNFTTAQQADSLYGQRSADPMVAGYGKQNEISTIFFPRKQAGGSIEDFGYNPSMANLNPFLDRYMNMRSQNQSAFNEFKIGLGNLTVENTTEMQSKINPFYKREIRNGNGMLMSPDQASTYFQTGGSYNVPEDYWSDSYRNNPNDPRNYWMRSQNPAPKAPEGYWNTNMSLEEQQRYNAGVHPQSPVHLKTGWYTQENVDFPGMEVPDHETKKINTSHPRWNAQVYNTKPNVGNSLPAYPPTTSGSTPQVVPVVANSQSGNVKSNPNAVKTSSSPSTKTSSSGSKPKTTAQDDVAKAQEVLNAPSTQVRRGNVTDDETTSDGEDQSAVMYSSESPMQTIYANIQGRERPFYFNPENTHLSRVDFRKPIFQPGKQGAVKRMIFSHGMPESYQGAAEPGDSRFYNSEPGYSAAAMTEEELNALHERFANSNYDPDGFRLRFQQGGSNIPSWNGNWSDNEWARTQIVNRNNLVGSNRMIAPTMDFVAGFGRSMTEPDYPQEIMNRTGAENVFSPTYGDRGFNTFNKVGFDPVTNQTPVQFKGRSYKVGGEYEMDDEELKNFLKSGGQVEYID